MRLLPITLAASIAGFTATAAADVFLFEWAINRDGGLTGTGDPAPPGFDISTGLGTVEFTVTGAGSHGAFMFVDHELSENVNTFFNEIGTTSGTPASGQSWEIDEPGFDFGDIYDNFLAGTPDNTIGSAEPEDVAMLMGWNFDLAAGETGTVRFVLSQSQPGGGFYLTHTDPDSDEALYFSSSLRITTDGRVPDAGSTLGLAVLALAGLAGWRVFQHLPRLQGNEAEGR